MNGEGTTPNPVSEVLARRRAGTAAGLCSACTASGLAIEAYLERAQRAGGYVLVEATANQVDQRGGYTGMRPADFVRFVLELADARGFPRQRVILGGDHLGPLTWRKLPADRAMAEATELVRLFVEAGFAKIHLDTSMHLGDDDPASRLPAEAVATRAARLARCAEDAYQELRRRRPGAPAPVYVVGSEVPVPGGTTGDEGLEVTRPEDLVETIETFRSVFSAHGVPEAWERTVAVVVQPGVEFGDDVIHEYDRPAAAALMATLRRWPGLVFEGHSTDYQRPSALRAMVEDGVALLKVGPGLTFALREGLLALEAIEHELLRARPGDLSRFAEVLELEMLRAPEHWVHHYHGTAEELRLKRRYSYSDRCRYYLQAPPVRGAIDRLLANLAATTLPASLVSQFLPHQYARLREGRLAADPRALLRDRVGDTVDDFLQATGAQA
jgi:D-tagatose-1,6-bisphosphate aldolase subunit GatZ/KbaZ